MEKRLNRLSKDPKNFNNTKPSYQTALPQPKKQKKKQEILYSSTSPTANQLKLILGKKNSI